MIWWLFVANDKKRHTNTTQQLIQFRYTVTKLNIYTFSMVATNRSKRTCVHFLYLANKSSIWQQFCMALFQKNKREFNKKIAVLCCPSNGIFNKNQNEIKLHGECIYSDMNAGVCGIMLLKASFLATCQTNVVCVLL